ncbi:ABC transporter ATP-binding protein [Roseicyclus persicicus]|uniref:ABC transporter ATP-binding protein n=1 Tax=Roseicyclus persicicus TaxID=2650661 RepID=A0A7X6JZ64_9RHOB|nr:ABC transporter ATP-binding protein [Roseibacterium persicicum]NKX45209.1 ABC transporter ATP-binding protein [Roseibacterium persicicum]
MIRFENLTKSFEVNGQRKVVIDNLTLTVATGRSLALLGRNGAGKSTLMSIIAGNMRPDSGRILCDGTISWPIGQAGSTHPNMTGAQNARFIARVYGVDTEELVDFVEDFAQLGPHFHMPLRTYSSGMKARLSFGLSLGIKFDTYLIDEVTAAGDASFRTRSAALFHERMSTSDAIMVNHNLGELKEFCDAALILEHGKLQYFEDLDEAIEVHKRNMALPASRRGRAKG